MEYKPKKNTYGERVYIGNLEGEEFFLMPIKFDCGWYWGGIYLEGLRPETEETYRERDRDVEMSDFWDTKDIPSRYLNEDLFKDDYEDDWWNNNDIQEEQEREGEDYYLGFGTHTHADSIFLEECKGDYEIALKVFDKLYLNEKDFNALIQLLKRFYSLKCDNSKSKKYLDMIKKQEKVLIEYEEFIKKFPTLPTKEYWVNPEIN